MVNTSNELPSDSGHPETLQLSLDERIGRTMGYWGNADLEHDWYPEHTAKIKQLINDECVRELEEVKAEFQTVAIPETDDYANGWNDCRERVRTDLDRVIDWYIARRKGEKHGLA